MIVHPELTPTGNDLSVCISFSNGFEAVGLPELALEECEFADSIVYKFHGLYLLLHRIGWAS